MQRERERHTHTQRGGIEEGGQVGGKGQRQGAGLTYMRWEGLQGGDTFLRVRAFPLGDIGLQARASLIHRQGAAGPR